jgi:protoheme IX farnesyltransferase
VEWAGIYAELGKSRLSALVVSTTAAGHLMSSAPLEPATFAAALGGTFLLSASANSFNQLIEVRNDAAMNRTSKRPLPAGRISPTHAAGWAAGAGATGVTTLFLGTDCVTASLGALTLGLYTLVYTPMKQRTPLNTWVGAVVGAIPPVMGWTAAGGALLSLEAATLGASLFLWQMPHFFALSWMYRDDYKQGGYKMIPLNDATGERTSWLCLEYSLYLAALPPICWAAGLTSCMFAIESVAFNGALLAAAWRFHRNSSRGQAHARRLFLVSLGYLPLFFGCLLLHQKRQPVEQPLGLDAASAEDGLASTVELEAVRKLAHTAAVSIDESREAAREVGRGLCLHEQLASAPSTAADVADGLAGASISSDAHAVPADGNASDSAHRCPVVMLSKSASVVASPAAVASSAVVASPAAAQQPQPQH